MIVFQKESKKKLGADGSMNCFALGSKEVYGKGTECQFLACTRSSIGEWRKKGYSIVTVTANAFSLKFGFTGLQIDGSSVDATLSVQLRIMESDPAFKVFVQRHLDDGIYTDEMLRDELLSSHWQLQGFVQQLFSGRKLELLQKYGKNAVDWSGLGTELPSWLIVDRIESLNLAAVNPDVEKKIEIAVMNYNNEMDSFRNKLKKIRESFLLTVEVASSAPRLISAIVESWALRGLKMFVVLALCAWAYGWVSNHILPCRIELQIKGSENAKAFYENTIEPELGEFIKANNQALYERGGVWIVECVSMRKSERVAFQKVMRTFAKGKHYISLTGGEPEWSFDWPYFFLRKSTYLLSIAPRELETASIYVCGSNPEIERKIYSYLKERYGKNGNFKSDAKAEYDGHGAVLYSFQAGTSDLINDVFPFIRDLGVENEEEVVAENLKAFFFPDGKKWYEVDFGGIHDVRRKDAAKKIFAPIIPHGDIIRRQKWSAEQALKYKEKLDDEKFTVNSLASDNCIRMIIAEKPCEGVVVLSGVVHDKVLVEKILACFDKVKNGNPFEEEGVIEFPIKYAHPSAVSEIIEKVSKLGGERIKVTPANPCRVEILPMKDMVSIDIGKLIAYTDQLRVAEKIAERKLEKSVKKNDGNTIEGKIVPAEVTALRKAFEDAGFEVVFNTRGDNHSLMLSYTPPPPPTYVYSGKIFLNEDDDLKKYDAANKNTDIYAVENWTTRVDARRSLRFVEVKLISPLPLNAVRDKLFEELLKIDQTFLKRDIKIN